MATSANTPIGNSNLNAAGNIITLVADNGFQCSMDGFTDLVFMSVNVLLGALVVVKETYLITLEQILPDLATSINYLWDGMVGVAGWIGFAVAAGYYFGAEAGYAREICDGMGIFYTIIEPLYNAIAFNQDD